MTQDNGFPHDKVVFSDPGEEFVYPTIPIITEDDAEAHTEENGYCCGDPTCYCALGASATEEETSC